MFGCLLSVSMLFELSVWTTAYLPSRSENRNLGKIKVISPAGTNDGDLTIFLCEPTLIFFTFILIMLLKLCIWHFIFWRGILLLRIHLFQIPKYISIFRLFLLCKPTFRLRLVLSTAYVNMANIYFYEINYIQDKSTHIITFTYSN
jgi:hypothetical protein